MALMVPDAIPKKASQGEKKLFKILRDELPDDFYVWYEPQLKGIYPDFIVLGPTWGLLILEVKGWSAGQIIRANHEFFEIKQDIDLDGKTEIKIESNPSPLRQAKGYQDTLLNQLKGYSILTEDDGDYLGKLTFPVGVGAIMSNITEAKARDESIYSLLERPQVAYRNELLDWDGIGERLLIKRLGDMFTVKFNFMPLTDDQINTIRGIIHPEIKIKTESATKKSVPEGIIKPDSIIIKSLDHKQEQIALSIASGHRLFCGVAGSGKTLILLSRAKAIAGKFLHNKVLILCFNITLAAYLRSMLEFDTNPFYREKIQVVHFHGWAKSILGHLPNLQLYQNDGDDYDEEIGDRLLAALKSIPTDEKWDAVFVDEAHTFSPSWFRCCVAALQDPEEGDLVIVSDGSQSFYQRRKFS